MFELEIMVTGYTLVIASVSGVIARCFNRTKLNQLNNELKIIKNQLFDAQSEIKALKIKQDVINEP